MFTTQFWLIVIGIVQMIGCSWIFSKFQKTDLQTGNPKQTFLCLVG